MSRRTHRPLSSGIDEHVGVGPTLSDALNDVLGIASGTPTPGTQTPGTETPGTQTPGSQLPVRALKLLQQADAKFREADAALRRGDLQGYADAVTEGRKLVEQALAAGQKKK